MRVFVTAVGIVSPLAVGAEATFRALVRGDRALRPMTLFDVGSSRRPIVAEVQELDIAAFSAASPFPVARVDAMAIVAAREALAGVGLSKNAIVDLVTSGVQGGMFETETTLVAMYRRSKDRAPDPSLVMHPVSATADRLREIVFPFRRARTVSNACSGGATAIVLAEAWIRSGRSSSVLAGGADALCRFTLAGFNLLSSLDPAPCRPFDVSRAGLNLGEGAAYLLLESEDEVNRRNVVPLAELTSATLGSEGKHIIQPEENGETRARLVRDALARARLSPADIGYINAHGTATPQNDVTEAAAYRAVFGADIERIPVSSCKGQVGHALGAAAAIEAAVTVLAVHHGEIPPTGGLSQPDPRCNLLHVMGSGRRHDFRAAISTSAGFGGANAVLCFAKTNAFDEPATRHSSDAVVVTSAVTWGPLGLGGAQPSLEYLKSGPPPEGGPAVISTNVLDADKVRRYDAAALRLVLVAKTALEMAYGENMNVDAARIGIVTGLALRGGDGGASFLAPVLESGFRTGKPIVFPGLLPSSPTSQASIYLSIRGPAMTTIDREASAGAAFSAAVDLLDMQHADALIVTGLSEWDDLTWQAVGPVCFGSAAWPEPLTDGAGALVVERAQFAEARGAPVLAKLVARQSDAGPRLREVPGPTDVARALVVAARLGRPLDEVLGDSDWARVRRVGLAARAGAHEALGAMALVAAAHAIASKEADEVLVVDFADGRLEAFLFGVACS